MLRSAAVKSAWLGRPAPTVPGLAMALVLGTSSRGLASNGDNSVLRIFENTVDSDAGALTPTGRNNIHKTVVVRDASAPGTPIG